MGLNKFKNAGVPSRPFTQHACECRSSFCCRAFGETSANLVGSERVRRHPHHRD